jgi:hypothetical protein
MSVEKRSGCSSMRPACLLRQAVVFAATRSARKPSITPSSRFCRLSASLATVTIWSLLAGSAMKALTRASAYA